MSEIRATTISDAAGTGPITLTGQSAAKAFVGYNSITSHFIRISLNVSSIVDDAIGKTTVNFTNNFASSTSLCCADVHGSPATTDLGAAYFDAATIIPYHGYSASSVRQHIGYRAGSTSSFADDYYANVIIHGDLA